MACVQMEGPKDTASVTLHRLFSEASKSFASNTAIVFDNGTHSAIVDYGTLAELSGKLSEELRQHGVNKQQVIALRGTEYDRVIIAILGILQVPAAFMFIPADAPVLRMVNLLSRLGASLLITNKELLQRTFADLKSSFLMSSKTLNVSGRTCFVFVELKPIHPHLDVPVMPTPPFAYVVCTSGTTGRPKIVKVPHQCIVPNILHLRKIFKVSPADVIFNASPLTFDPSIVEMFLALSMGAKLVTVTDGMRKVPNSVVSTLIRHKVSILQVTPSFLFRISQEQLHSTVLSSKTSLRVLAFGGEPCPSLEELSKWCDEDNKTEIFNLYGITEVSSWASCHRLEQDCARNSDRQSVPLGQPLWETLLEVRDENGKTVSEGEGKLFIGSHTRICYIDDECGSLKQEAVFRDSGDFVRITPSGLVFLGRKDDQFKRFGKRFNLKEIRKVIESFPEVLQCEVSLDKSMDPAKIYAFFTPTVPEWTAAPSNKVEERIKQTELCQALKMRLKDHIPEQGLPDHVFMVQSFPLTPHGKMDVSCLTEWAHEYLTAEFGTQSSHSSGKGLVLAEIEDYLEKCFKETLALTRPLDKQKSFIELGGTSFQVVTLVEQLERCIKNADLELLDLILHCSFTDIRDRLISELQSEETSLPGSREPFNVKLKSNFEDKATDCDKNSIYSISAPTGRICGKKTPVGEEQIQVKTTFAEDFESSKSSGNTISSKRMDGTEQSDTLNNVKTDSLEISWSKRKRRKNNHMNGPHLMNVRTITRGDCVVRCSSAPVVAMETEDHQQQTIMLKEDWRVDLEKCIDASPLVVMDERLPNGVVYIGSHSGIFVAIDTVTSERIWQVGLPDRIESSACLSPCKNFVVVGCYDNSIYFFDQYTGSEYWSFATQGMVKSSPTPSAVTGLVYVGSHDGNLYALNPATKTCTFSVHLGGGSVFSSPCVDRANESVYVASLSGRLLCVSWVSGVIQWSYQCPKPLFSSPAVTPSGVVIGCVDGYVYCLSHLGQMIYSIRTEAPIFSSPCAIISKNKEVVLIGSHDGYVYSLTNGSVRWRTKIGTHVYSTPSCIFNILPEEAGAVQSTGDHKDTLDWTSGMICCCSTDGLLAILDVENGELMSSSRLPGELFSSPVFMEDGRVIVACRNDNLFCFSLVTIIDRS